MDKFPEAFDRFKKKVDTKSIKSFKRLTNSFRFWVQNQNITRKQIKALAVEARKIGIKPSLKENVIIKRKHYTRWRDVTTGRFTKNPEV